MQKHTLIMNKFNLIYNAYEVKFVIGFYALWHRTCSTFWDHL